MNRRNFILSALTLPFVAKSLAQDNPQEKLGYIDISVPKISKLNLFNHITDDELELYLSPYESFKSNETDQYVEYNPPNFPKFRVIKYSPDEIINLNTPREMIGYEHSSYGDLILFY